MDRHQRSASGLGAGGAKGASVALEDRGALSREQAVDRHRALPMSQRTHPTQPHRLLSVGLESLEAASLPERADALPDQARSVARLPRSAAQESQCSDGFCVSPDHYGVHQERRELYFIIFKIKTAARYYANVRN